MGSSAWQRFTAQFKSEDGSHVKKNIGTICGVLAILMWGSSVAATRLVSESFGPYSAAAGTYGLGGTAGIIAVLAQAAVRRLRRRASGGGAADGAGTSPQFASPEKYVRFGIDWRYTLINGALFVSNTFAFSIAVGLSTSRSMSVEVGLINYLWTGLMFAVAIGMPGFRTRWYEVRALCIGASLS
eukprot:TRINITY_DN6130_c0_g1_i1.p2 TRINITY_DN6130_c0_g1~~TRINITY_DN6130_c0_g1_i1.p2  ORF type:complete len:185 (-),score=28.13 TRINITY_DN6130_c0_g1_i1:38-592(-)